MQGSSQKAYLEIRPPIGSASSPSIHSLASRPRMGNDNPGWAPSDGGRDARSVLSISISPPLRSRVVIIWIHVLCFPVSFSGVGVRPSWLANCMVTLWLVRPIRLGGAHRLWQFPVSIRHPIYKIPHCLHTITHTRTSILFRRRIHSDAALRTARGHLYCVRRVVGIGFGCARKGKLRHSSPRVLWQCRVGDDSGQIAKPIHNMSLDVVSCFQSKQAAVR